MWEEDPLCPIATSQKGVLPQLYPVGPPGLAVVGYASDTAHIASPTGQYLAHIVVSNI